MGSNRLDAVTVPTGDHARLESYCRALASGLRPGNIVLIGGLSRSGKTTFANCLRSAVLEQGCNAWTLSLDRWLKDIDFRLPGVLGRYDLSIIHGVVACHTLCPEKSQTLRLPEYDKLQQKTFFSGKSILIQSEDILIIEGTVGLTLPLNQCHVLRFFVDIDESERKRRVIGEYLMRGKDRVESEAIYAARQVDETPEVIRSSFGATRINISALCNVFP